MLVLAVATAGRLRGGKRDVHSSRTRFVMRHRSLRRHGGLRRSVHFDAVLVVFVSAAATHRPATGFAVFAGRLAATIARGLAARLVATEPFQPGTFPFTTLPREAQARTGGSAVADVISARIARVATGRIVGIGAPEFFSAAVIRSTSPDAAARLPEARQEQPADGDHPQHKTQSPLQSGRVPGRNQGARAPGRREDFVRRSSPPFFGRGESSPIRRTLSAAPSSGRRRPERFIGRRLGGIEKFVTIVTVDTVPARAARPSHRTPKP